jgi:hypothetical protein
MALVADANKSQQTEGSVPQTSDAKDYIRGLPGSRLRHPEGQALPGDEAKIRLSREVIEEESQRLGKGGSVTGGQDAYSHFGRD